MAKGKDTETGELKSMTGFGRATDTREGSSINVTIRTVNHRNLEQSIRMPERLWEIESALRSRIAGRLERGKVDLSVRTTGLAESSQLSIDEELAGNLIEGLVTLGANKGVPFQPRLETIIGIPGVISTSNSVEDLGEEEKERLFGLVDQALERVVEMRVREGEALASDIASRLDEMEERTKGIGSLREKVVEEQSESLRKRIADLAREVDAELLEERVTVEVAVMAEKMDIVEEITRLHSHIEQMRELLSAEGPVGRKMDFLCQEMTREVNTIGSKSRTTELKNHVIEFKAEIERVREQVQNVE